MLKGEIESLKSQTEKHTFHGEKHKSQISFIVDASVGDPHSQDDEGLKHQLQPSQAPPTQISSPNLPGFTIFTFPSHTHPFAPFVRGSKCCVPGICAKSAQCTEHVFRCPCAQTEKLHTSWLTFCLGLGNGQFASPCVCGETQNHQK